MTRRILGIELRRSAALVAAALSLPLAFMWPAVADGMNGVVGRQRGELVLLVPLALGLGAWQAGRDRRSRTTELLASTARPSWQRRLQTAVATGIGAMAGYFLVFAGLVAYGMAVGAYVPMFVIASAMVIGLCLAVALAAACFILYVAARHFRLAALLPVALGTTLAVSLLPQSLYDALTLDQDALALVCTPDEQVCARRMHPLVLNDLREPGHQALAILSAKLPQAPTRVVEGYHGNDLPVDLESEADTLHADVLLDGSGRVDATRDELLWTFLNGAGTLACPDVSGASLPRYNAARLIAAAWLLDKEPPPPADLTDPALPGPNITIPAYEALLALPPEEQRARVTALREAELACSGGDLLNILGGDGADTG